MRKTGRLVGLAVLMAAMLLSGCKDAKKTEAVFPSKEITLVVPYDAGGANDRAARMLASIAQEKGFIEKPMVVTNISGAATKSGISTVAKADPDGYTLLVHHNAMLTAAALGQLEEELQWDNCLRPVAEILETPLTFAVMQDSRWTTMKDLMDDIEANPGEIKFGFPGINAPQAFSFQNVVNEMKEEGRDISVHSVFLEGGSAVKTAHYNGTIDVVPGITMDTVSDSKGGTYRILSVVSEKRLDMLPDVPTLKEAGYPMPQQSDGALRMIVWAPKETPDQVVGQLESIIRQVCETDEWKSFIDENAAVNVYRNADEVREIFQKDEKAYEQVAPALLESQG